MKITNDLVVFDLETTGTWIEKDKIVEIAMIKVKEDGKRETYHKQVNPGIPIPKEVVELIRISDEDVKDAPKFEDIVQEVLDFIGKSDLAGFNVERFDLPLLARECDEAGVKFAWQDHVVYDAQKVYHLNEKRDLTAAYQFYCQKNLDNAHSALADTEATLDILMAQTQKYSEEKEPAIEELAQFNYRRSAEFYDADRKFRWWNGKLYMMFGKYARRKSLDEIAKKDRPYLEWILSADFSEEVKLLVENAIGGKIPKDQSDTQMELFK